MANADCVLHLAAVAEPDARGLGSAFSLAIDTCELEGKSHQKYQLERMNVRVQVHA